MQTRSTLSTLLTAIREANAQLADRGPFINPGLIERAVEKARELELEDLDPADLECALQLVRRMAEKSAHLRGEATDTDTLVVMLNATICLVRERNREAAIQKVQGAFEMALNHERAQLAAEVVQLRKDGAQ